MKDLLEKQLPFVYVRNLLAHGGVLETDLILNFGVVLSVWGWELRAPGFGPIPLKVGAQIWILKQHFSDTPPLVLSFLRTTCLGAADRTQK